MKEKSFRQYKQSHYLEADFKRPLFELDDKTRESIREKLVSLYGEKNGATILPEFERIISVYHAYKTEDMVEWEKDFVPESRFNEKDAILITYGDLIKDERQKPLETLAEICESYLSGVFNTIHILPFFPYSSDRGFAIMDFRQVDPSLGRWEDISRMESNFKLMFDGVFNHISSKSFWFQEFLNGNPDYADFFTAFSEKRAVPREKINKLMRPRTSDVLTQFHTYSGKKKVWTTFSPDQVDLKFQNPKVLLRITEILLYYVRRGADIIRLDAVTYLWDELGTEGAHLWQTHSIIKLFRVILDAVAPHVALITETNVPHRDNISYFGNGIDEAQLVYNFALPPLVLHTIQTGNAAKLTDWAKTLKNPSKTASFFNFLDSHDGIGLLGAQNILTDDEIAAMAERVVKHGGFISYRKDKDGRESPYELNITSYSAMNRENSDEPRELQVKRYLAARSIPLVIIGVPGIYLHGLLGSSNDIDAIKNGGDKRSINRNILFKHELIKSLEDENTATHMVSYRLSRMIHKRIAEAAFHPQGEQQVLNISDTIFAVLRSSLDRAEYILALTNVTGKQQEISLDTDALGIGGIPMYDILSKIEHSCPRCTLSLTLEAYQVCWLKGVKDADRP